MGPNFRKFFSVQKNWAKVSSPYRPTTITNYNSKRTRDVAIRQGLSEEFLSYSTTPPRSLQLYICALSWLYILLNRLSLSVQKILIFKDLSVWRAKTLQSCWSIRIYSQVNYSSFLFCFRLSLWVLFSVNFLSGADLFCLFLELDLCL